MKTRSSFICGLLIIISFSSYSQLPLGLNGKDNLNLYSKNEYTLSLSHKSDKMLGPLAYVAIAAFVINPILVFENKKVYFGLTKEVSIGKYPYGRLAFEYSFIFRDTNKSHLRLSYNYDVILEAGDFIAFVLTPGAGYFTDTKNKGWFGHVSFGALLAADEFGLVPYFRYRFTYINNKKPGKSNINDISLGMGLFFYF